ncbi:diguanylate cyclase [Phenylobacterium sp. SCN 70-31]|uniref:diguanylate cyclase domain-containing protein n=1 Tax=Phenylobacterium sp. SCN 70-31 TaxID=1660129 RepID=UPI0008699DB6|nr:diguanylate cyclase [Phenylobacterium sp. SCN 70-31]ODT88074.1 MAG: response regulator [Phenylobacterium sp. SCN 70-31]
MTAGVQARVLIVARDDSTAGPLAEGLDRLGWRTVTARTEAAALVALADLQIQAAIVDLSGLDDPAGGVAGRLRAACAPRRLPVLAMSAPDALRPDQLSDHLPEPLRAGGGFDLTLAGPLHPAQAAMRLETLVRTAVSEEELEIRVETFAERGHAFDAPADDPAPFRVLAIGEPAPQFLALSNALARHGAEVVGAFTAFTAFDYLHERPFDAVVLWAADNPHEALSIAAGLRRNTRLYHTPALLYMRAQSAVTAAEAYHRGISDVASPETPESETALRVVELARAYRRQKSVRAALEQARHSGLMDAATGLFTRDLFAAHLMRLARSARARNRPLSVCMLKVAEKADLHAPRSGGWVARAIPQIGSMIGRLVRVEDTAARLAPEVFALALPATSFHAARAAGERIAAVIGCTAFEAGSGATPFVVEFDLGVAEVTSPDGVGYALEQAAAMAQSRIAS